MLADKEDHNGKIRGILIVLIGSLVGHSFDTGVIGDLLVVVCHGTGLILPPTSRIVNVGERRAVKLQN